MIQYMCIMDSSGTMETTVTSQEMTHPLYDKWVLWAHLPHDTDWSLKSYKKIMTVTHQFRFESFFQKKFYHVLKT